MIRKGDVEAGFAELEVGRLLCINNRSFRFIEPKGVKGDDYDLEIEFENVTACAETKCKLETTTAKDKDKSLLQADAEGPPRNRFR